MISLFKKKMQGYACAYRRQQLLRLVSVSKRQLLSAEQELAKTSHSLHEDFYILFTFLLITEEYISGDSIPVQSSRHMLLPYSQTVSGLDRTTIVSIVLLKYVIFQFPSTCIYCFSLGKSSTTAICPSLFLKACA